MIIKPGPSPDPGPDPSQQRPLSCVILRLIGGGVWSGSDMADVTAQDVFHTKLTRSPSARQLMTGWMKRPPNGVRAALSLKSVID